MTERIEIKVEGEFGYAPVVVRDARVGEIPKGAVCSEIRYGPAREIIAKFPHPHLLTFQNYEARV